MSEPPPQVVAGDAVVSGSTALTPDQVAAVLADFRDWLSALQASPEGPPPDEDGGPDLYTFLEQLTALRHEINLQTKAVRSQQEQNAGTLDQLSRALDSLAQTRDSAAEDRTDRLRPLLKTLVDLHDALSVAGREAQRVQDSVVPVLREAVSGAADEPPELPPYSPPPLLARWFGARDPDMSRYRAGLASWRKRRADQEEQRGKGFERVRQLLASLTTGYTMGLQRVERALKQHGLEAMPAVGQPFDPERMEAVEAVLESGQPAGQVIDEVQRGYLWNGRVFRFAKVRVAKS
jgi:molecular chaperone GrpE